MLYSYRLSNIRNNLNNSTTPYERALGCWGGAKKNKKEKAKSRARVGGKQPPATTSWGLWGKSKRADRFLSSLFTSLKKTNKPNSFHEARLKVAQCSGCNWERSLLLQSGNNCTPVWAELVSLSYANRGHTHTQPKTYTQWGSWSCGSQGSAYVCLCLCMQNKEGHWKKKS